MPDRIVRHQVMRFFQIDPLDAVSGCKLVDIDGLHRIKRHRIKIVVGQNDIIVLAAGIALGLIVVLDRLAGD
ncbi:hypothetical protein D3C71_1197200 [compost metagenome]